MKLSPGDSPVSLPLCPLLYLHRGYRQDRRWTYRQALSSTILKGGLRAFVAVRLKQSLSLRPRCEGERFAVMAPASPKFYTGVAAHSTIHPESIGGTWYPTPWRPPGNGDAEDTQTIVLHLHGGSFLVGDGRTATCHFLAQMILANTPASHVFCPQYRLAWTPHGRFPAPLQDTITAYVYLLQELHISPSRISVSGDSCGATLALGLLRYLHEHPILPPPQSAWLYSPWCDIPAALDAHTWKDRPNYASEYVPGAFPSLGATLFLREVDLTDPVAAYVAPLWYPFPLPAPALIVTGEREVMVDEHRELADHLRGVPANRDGSVALCVTERVPHDPLMIGWLLGFQEETRMCVRETGVFARGERGIDPGRSPLTGG